MNTKFKPGDKVRFKKQSIEDWHSDGNFWYKDYPIKVTDSFTIVKWTGYNWACVHNSGTRQYNFSEHYLELASPPLSQEELIIQKIKYLDTRFKERKHATV